MTTTHGGPADWYTRDPAYVPRSAIPAHVEGQAAEAASTLGPAVYRAEDTTGGDGG